MKALLIDDHPLILSALRAVIEGMQEGVVVTTAANARAAREALYGDTGFDLVLLDLQLGDADGFELLTEFRAARPALPVVVISASDNTHDVLRSVELGAMGFIPKRASNELMFEALKTVMAGSIFVPPMTMAFETSQASSYASTNGARSTFGAFPGLRNGAQRSAPVSSQSFSPLGLTPRQTDVLGLLLQGQPNKLIARELNLSVETVKDHVAAVLRTLNVSSRTQAVLAVNQMGHGAALTAHREARRG